MLTASSFAIHVTYTCPLACAHCCFLSGPDVKDRLDPELIISSIHNLPETVQMVAFTGGEPFLHGKNLARYVQTANQIGYKTRVVTSAYFGKTKEIALKRMKELAHVGLDELSISWDDFHEEFVDFSCVRNVAQASVELGISTAISSVQVEGNKWTKKSITDGLGDVAKDITVVCESHLNLTGRADEKLRDRKPKPNGYLGPCPYVITGPTLSAKGKLIACCGVIPDTERLSIADSFRPEDIPDLIQSSFSNPLLLWLFLRGPYALIEGISLENGINQLDKERIGGNCEACKLALDKKGQYEPRIDAFLGNKLHEIAHELLLLESLGFLNATKIRDVWSSSSAIRVGL